jgi:hypothetical protein
MRTDWRILILEWLELQWNYLYFIYKSPQSFNIGFHRCVVCCTVWSFEITCKVIAAYIEGLDAPAAWLVCGVQHRARVLYVIWRMFNHSNHFIITDNKKRKTLNQNVKFTLERNCWKPVLVYYPQWSLPCLALDQVFKFKFTLLKNLKCVMYTLYGDCRNMYITTERIWASSIILVGLKCDVFGYGFVDSPNGLNFCDLTGQEDHPSLHLSSSAVYGKL